MVAIADIPSREVLLSMLANLLNSPMQRLAVGLKAVADARA
jgi:ribosomal protein L10